MFGALLYLVYIFVLASIVCYFFLLPDRPPLCGVYSQPGKFYLIKYAFFRVLYWLRQKQQERAQNSSDGGNGGKPAGYGVKSKSDVKDMEKMQTLPSEAPLAVDAVYFNAADRDGAYFVASCARRHENVSQVVLMIYLPEIGLLELPSLPDTSLRRTDEDSKKQFGASGLTIEPLEPMKRWRIRYEGELRLNGDEKQIFKAKLHVDWTACSDYFDFDTDMNAHALAASIAREPWSREFFERLRVAHQTHHEQFGDYRGTITLSGGSSPGGELQRQLNMRGGRDHSYGNIRQWSHFHRYAMQFVHTEDGLCFNAAVVSIPNVTMSRLEFGYVFKNGRKLALRSVDIPLADLGETTEAPRVYEFRFEDEERTKYEVECEVLHRPYFYIGEGGRRDAIILEQMCRYKVNGKRGWGLSEWQYRYDDYKTRMGKVDE
jgi:hypothetical protein